MAHNCPECGKLCYCDFEDIDWGDDCNEDCIHYLSEDCKPEGEEEEDE